MMKVIEMMLQSHPQAEMQRASDRFAVISALSACEQACSVCADAALGETMHLETLLPCILISLDCAEVCRATARLLMRQTESGSTTPLSAAQLQACAIACQLCTDMCEVQAEDYNFCRICADVCSHCKERCDLLLGELATAAGDVGEDSSSRLHGLA